MFFFQLIKVHFLVSELYIYQNARYNDNITPINSGWKKLFELTWRTGNSVTFECIRKNIDDLNRKVPKGRPNFAFIIYTHTFRDCICLLWTIYVFHSILKRFLKYFCYVKYLASYFRDTHWKAWRSSYSVYVEVTLRK